MVMINGYLRMDIFDSAFRFCSTKSGRIYLHTDIRMIVLRKSDVDTASAHIPESSHEWKSFTRGPSNPRFSSR